MIVQQVYILVRLGRIEDAENLAAEVEIQGYVCQSFSLFTNSQQPRIPEDSTKHIAQINKLTATTAPLNPYLTHRTVHSTKEGTKADRPFEYQSVVLKEDARVLDLAQLKYSGVARSTAKALSQNEAPAVSSAVNTVSVINAAATAQNAVGKAGIKAILPLLEKRPNDVGLLLTVIQLYVLTNNHGSAISLLESFLSRLEQSSSSTDQDVRFAPGLVATLVSLYSAHSRRSHIRAELAKAAAYWREKYKSSSDSDVVRTATGLLKATGTELLSTPNPADQEVAASIFSNLHSTLPSDPAAVAGFVASHAVSDSSSVKPALLDSLPQAQRLVTGIDAAALEAAGVASLPVPTSAAVKRGADKPTKDKKVDEPQKKKRKLSAKRTPKDFVEGKEMDPERWLPMRDRTYYRPKGKKGKSRMGGGGTQGGVVDEKLEGGKAPQAGAQGGAGSGGGKKKPKKKGAKW